MSSEYSEQDIGERVKKYYEKRKLIILKAKSERIEIVKDFLPSPSELARRESNVRVTINLKEIER